MKLEEIAELRELSLKSEKGTGFCYFLYWGICKAMYNKKEVCTTGKDCKFYDYLIDNNYKIMRYNFCIEDEE